MKNITLISDWKLRDPYIAIFKGLILKEIGDVNFIDISHAVPLCDISQTAFLLKWSYPSFPDDTLHIILTGAVNDPDIMPVWVKCGNHCFIGTDNGIFSLLFGIEEDVVARQYDMKTPSESFIDRVVKMVVWHFGGKIENNTTSYDDFKPVLRHEPQIDTTENKLIGHIA